MRARLILIFAAAITAGAMLTAQAPKRFNPMVELLAAKKPIFGLYAPSNRRFGGGGPGAPGGAPRPAAPAPADAPPPKSPAQLAKEAVEFANSDFIFDGSMEGDFDRALPPFTELINGMSTAGILIKSPKPHLSHAVVVKTHEIAESTAGLEKVREIAAVKGIGVLWPGAGTLRGVFSTQQPDGTRKLDEAAWEASIQKVLAACKEFNVPCGYPATPTDIEMRMKQGFSVFVMNWGDPGFEAIKLGKKAAGR